MLGNFDEVAQQTLLLARNQAKELCHPYVGTEHFVLAILKENNQISNKLKEFNIDYDQFKEQLIKIMGTGTKKEESFLYTPLLKNILETVMLDNKDEITIEDLFNALLDSGEGIAIRIFIKLGADIDELYHTFNNGFTPKKINRKDLMVLEIGEDLNEKALNNEIDPVIGRNQEINRVIEILCRRTKNNPVLIGEAGVGKTAIVEELARKIVNGDVPDLLRNKRIISINMASLVAGTKYRGEFEERINKMLKELETNDEIIIFIDEIHTLVGAGGAEGAIDASNIFKPALARNKLRCIGATTIYEYKKYIETDGALERRFQKVQVDIPDKKTVKEILTKLKPIYESFHHVIIPEQIIDNIIELSNKYIYDRFEPDKSIDILDEVSASVSIKETNTKAKLNKLTKKLIETRKKKNDYIINQDFKNATSLKLKEKKLISSINNLELEAMTTKELNTVTIEDIAKTINIKTGIPVYEILNDDNKLIEKINEEITKNIIGQEQAIRKLINIAKRIKLGLKDDNKCNSCLFVGPTGVGKTILATQFGKAIYGDNIIKLDMSDYIEAHSVSKIIGSPPGYVGYQDNKNILEIIRNHPYSVLILDEIEKANTTVLNLFLQILDEGKIKDASSREVRFDNVLIIMTSNVGFNENIMGFNNTNKKIIAKLKERFNIEFLNRIDDYVIFNKLNEEVINTIIDKEFIKLKQKYLKRGIKITIDKDLKTKVKELCEYQDYGARKIEKVIKTNVENYIIDKIIEGKNNIVAKCDIINMVM